MGSQGAVSRGLQHQYSGDLEDGSARRNGEREPLLAPAADEEHTKKAQAAKLLPQYNQALITNLVVCAWFCCNIGTALLNKYLLAVYGFKRPVFLTLSHMVACSLLSFAASASGFIPKQSLRSHQQGAKVALLAVVFCASVVCGNVALRFIPVSFAQAISATSPIFAALFSFLLLKSRERLEVYATLLPIVMGVVVASNAEPLFDAYGLLAGVSSTALRGFKSVLQGLLLTDPGEKLSSMSLLLYMAPTAALVLLPVALLLEPTALAEAAQLGSQAGHFWLAMGCSGVLAYLLNLANFLVTRYTSAITLQVLGNVKVILAVLISVAVFRNPLTFGSAGGFLITLAGAALYSRARQARPPPAPLPPAPQRLPR